MKTRAFPRRFENVVVLITGASSGFGLAIARAFAREGAALVLMARNPHRLQQVSAELQPPTGNRLLAIAGDVSQRADVERVVTEAIARFGRVDLLINNAGSGLIAPVDVVQLPDAVALFQTNFFGALNCIQAVLPSMQRQRAGHILIMASVAGLRGIPNSSMYSASKAALIALAEALRIEVKRYGIAVSTVCPSRTPVDDTGFFTHAKKYGTGELYKIPETLTVADVVQAVLELAAHPKRLTILPFHARLVNIVNKFAPSLVDRFLAKNLPKLDFPKSQP